MSSRRRRAASVLDTPAPLDKDVIFDTPKPKRIAPLEPQTDRQADYINAIKTSTITFGIGPAGTGKTYVCAAMAADGLKAKSVTRLIVTRPAVEAGESLGFLPGELHEKFEPYLRPFRDVLNERLGASFVEHAMKCDYKKIEAIPLAYIRGMTFKDCWVILDEAQNTTPKQMKMFLTRLGQHAKLIINGDPKQRDIDGPSGLTDAVDRLQGLPGVSTVRFTNDDIVRHDLTQSIIERYEEAEVVHRLARVVR